MDLLGVLVNKLVEALVIDLRQVVALRECLILLVLGGTLVQFGCGYGALMTCLSAYVLEKCRTLGKSEGRVEKLKRI
ncbi:hypothetical protein [Gardnerella vaginalis]|uniref:hypothetical protein n=1 Tax=Gardnerella vaginalis TaxID=2702 RepID=UPI0039EF60BA